MAHIKGRTGDWEYVIGLEIHAQVRTKSKLFSSAPNSYGDAPNSQVSVVDAAMPGMLPVLNEHAVHQAIKTGLGINGTIQKLSAFDRKNYFYADLPQGYQISQFYHPIVTDGHVDITDKDGNHKRIRVERIHLEQDAGKSMHDQSPTSSFIDLNRAGVPLMEIVSCPDLSSPEEAAEYVKKIRAVLRYLDTCDGDMDKGSMRCDANVSVRKAGDPLGTRCEIKNVNSVRNIMRAIEFEAMRQVELIEDGGEVSQETRLFDANTGHTRTMRSKEDAHDYRYFPDPDLPPLIVEEEQIKEIAKELPELPDSKIKRYMQEYSLAEYDASVIVADKAVAHYFEEVVQDGNAKLAATWISGEMFAMLNKTSMSFSDLKISAKQMSELLSAIADGTISGKIAKTVFEEMFNTGNSPKKIIEEQGLVQISSPDEIGAIIDQVIAGNQDKVEQYKSGKDKLFGFFVGQVMKVSGGKANPEMVNKILKQKLA